MVIEVRQENDVCVLRIEGRLAAGEDLEYLNAKAAELKRLNRGKVLIDLRDMPYIGSTGIGFLVGLFTTVTMNSGKFVLMGMQPRVEELFHLTRLNTIIPSAPDMASGLASLQGGSSRAAETRS